MAGIIDDIGCDVWLTPESGTPGLNAITDAEDFSLTGTADGYATGPGGQELLQMSGADALTATSSFLSGKASSHYLNGLHEDSQFWVMVCWNPDGDTGTDQVALQTSNAANTAGWRLLVDGDGNGGSVVISDGTSEVAPTWEPADRCDFVTDNTNILIAQFDIVNGFAEAWVNGRSSRLQALGRRDISGLSWPVIGSPRANAVDPTCSLNGEVMFATGSGILTEDQIQRLSQYGRGISYTTANTDGATPSNIVAWRGIPGETTLRVTGKYDADPTLRIYADTDHRTRGTEIANSGSLTRDTENWCSYEFTGLDPSTTYQVFAEYSGGAQDRYRGRWNTLPDSRDITIGYMQCCRFEPALAIDNATSIESAHPDEISALYNTTKDVVVHLGDDGYYDREWQVNLGGGFTLPNTVGEYNTIHDYIFDRLKYQEIWARTGMIPGAFSDHEFYGGEDWGDEVSSNRKTAAQAHLEQRYGLTYPLAPTNYYRTWQTPGLTWISLDHRTESDEGVQKTSAAQRAQMQSDMEAGVARGDLIILITDVPFNPAVGTPRYDSWNNFPAERTDVFDRAVAAGAMGETGSVNDRTIVMAGDSHNAGVAFDGTQQGGYDTGGIAYPATIISGTFNSDFYDTTVDPDAWPDFFDTSNGTWGTLNLQRRGPYTYVTATPYVGATAQTPVTRILLPSALATGTEMSSTLNYDWTGSTAEPSLTDLNSAIALTFTRATTGDVTDHHNATRTLPANVPRYQGARVIENLVDANSDSLNPTGSDWSEGTYINATYNYAEGPTGLMDATRLQSSTDGGSNLAVSSYVNTTGYTAQQPITYSMYAKADQSDWCYMRFAAALSGDIPVAWFDLANGVVGGTEDSIDAHGIEDAGNGWYRIWATITLANDVFNSYNIGPADADLVEEVDLDGGSSILVSRAQIEQIDERDSFGPYEYASSETGDGYRALASDYVINMIRDSDDMTEDATWITARLGSVVATTDSQGGNDAWVLTQESGQSNHGTRYQILDEAQIVDGETYTISMDAKAGTVDYLSIGETVSSGSPAKKSWFDLTNGTVGTLHGNHAGAIEDLGNGWYRCSITLTADGTNGTRLVIPYLADGDNDVTVSTDGTPSISVGRVQVNYGATAETYVSSSDGDTGRGTLDSIDLDGLLIEASESEVLSVADVSWMGTENSFYSKFTTGPNVTNATTLWSLHDGTANERISLEYSSSTLHFIGVDGGITQFDISTSIAADTTYEVAVRFGEDNVAMYLDGLEIGTDDTATMPTVTTLNIGSDHANSEQNSQLHLQHRNYNTALTDTELENLSVGVFPISGWIDEEIALYRRKRARLVQRYRRR